MSAKPIACHKCHFVWSFEPPLGRRDDCPQCCCDARVCMNCVFFDSGAYHECREEQAEWVKEKTIGNFCSYFRPNQAPAGTVSKADVARAKLDQLFGGKGSNDEPNAAASLGDQIKNFLSAKK